jgi:hypothetical protein
VKSSLRCRPHLGREVFNLGNGILPHTNTGKTSGGFEYTIIATHRDKTASSPRSDSRPAALNFRAIRKPEGHTISSR